MTKFVTIIGMLICIAACKTPEARKPITVKTGSFINASIERNKKRYALEKSQIETLMQKKDTVNFIASKSGFWYYYNSKTNDSINTTTPKFGDVVNYNYNIKDLNGGLIYSKLELKTQNYTMDKQQLFTGLREGLKLLKTGETATFIFPSQKAFGYYGDENKIGRNTPIICEVTINKITQTQ